MVDDEDVGGFGAPPRPLEEADAPPDVVTGEGQAGLVVGAQPPPDELILP